MTDLANIRLEAGYTTDGNGKVLEDDACIFVTGDDDSDIHISAPNARAIAERIVHLWNDADQPNESLEEMLRRELAAMNDACSRSDAEVMRLRAAPASFDATARMREALGSYLIDNDGEEFDDECELCDGCGEVMSQTTRSDRDQLGCPACIDRAHSRRAREALAAPPPTARPDREAVDFLDEAAGFVQRYLDTHGEIGDDATQANINDWTDCVAKHRSTLSPNSAESG